MDAYGYGEGGGKREKEREGEIWVKEGGTGWVGEKRDSDWYHCLRMRSLIFC